jgi:hypothetical protein
MFFFSVKKAFCSSVRIGVQQHLKLMDLYYLPKGQLAGMQQRDKELMVPEKMSLHELKFGDLFIALHIAVL